MDLATFRANYPEFANYSDGLIEEWAIVAQTLLPERKWTTLFKKVTGLYMAHQISVSKSPDKFDHQQPTKSGFQFTEFGKQLVPLIKIYGI